MVTQGQVSQTEHSFSHKQWIKTSLKLKTSGHQDSTCEEKGKTHLREDSYPKHTKITYKSTTKVDSLSESGERT